MKFLMQANGSSWVGCDTFGTKIKIMENYTEGIHWSFLRHEYFMKTIQIWQ